MTSDETTTDALQLNLPGIGIVTDWATQYRQNFIAIDDYLSGTKEVPSLAVTEVGGGVIGDHPVGQDTLTDFTGTGLYIDSTGALNVNESTGPNEVVAQSRRRVTTPVGGA